MASILRDKGYEVFLIDANGQNLSYAELEAKMRQIPYDILIFRFCATCFDWDMKTAEISKKINKKSTTIGRCFTLTNFEKEMMPEAPDMDIYIRNEFEFVTPLVVAALAEGKSISNIEGIAYQNNNELHINELAKRSLDFDSFPIPAYDLLPDLKNYFINTPGGKPFALIVSSSGCPYKCKFCNLSGKPWRMKSPDRVIEELRYLKTNFNIKTVTFFDECFTIDRNRVIKICETIYKEKMNIRWYCNSRVNLVDEELVQIMKRGGCRGIAFGIESGSQKVLDNANKGITVKQSEKAIKLLRKYGIKSYCSFVMGLPGETEETVKETIKFLKDVLPTGAQFNCAVPQPNTELLNIAIKNGWMTEELNWRELFEFKSIMRNDSMTTEQIEQARMSAYRSLYTNPRWYIQNVGHVIRNPEDFMLASRHAIKILNNFYIKKMKYSH
jgi:radical SAM superfamily enzyme YgiQ (UPF0313 family)